jgi:hypothetical protein
VLPARVEGRAARFLRKRHEEEAARERISRRYQSARGLEVEA